MYIKVLAMKLRTLYSESCKMVFKDYCYTLYPLTCCVSKNHTDQNLANKEALFRSLLICHKKHSGTLHRITCGVSSCTDLLKRNKVSLIIRQMFQNGAQMCVTNKCEFIVSEKRNGPSKPSCIY